MTLPFDEKSLRAALSRAWSAETARQWTPQTPAAGQCNVTAVVVQELFGGDICMTPLPGYDVPHFYNFFDTRRLDLTDAQFDTLPVYADTPTTRAHAMRWVTPSEHAAMTQNLRAQLQNG